MGNPFYPGNNQPQGNQNGIPNLNDAPPEVRGNMVQLFNWFASNLHGDPQQIVNSMFANGQMNNSLFGQLSQMANMFRGMFGRR